MIAEAPAVTCTNRAKTIRRPQMQRAPQPGQVVCPRGSDRRRVLRLRPRPDRRSAERDRTACRVTARSSCDDDPVASVFSVMERIRDEEHLRELLTLLVELAPDNDVLGVVGAGPLEDFVKAADDERLRWIESEADRYPKFRQALSQVWISGKPAQTFLRVQEAAGVELHWPDHLGPRPSAQAS
jgi:Family of unknown function (DUF6869)